MNNNIEKIILYYLTIFIAIITFYLAFQKFGDIIFSIIITLMVLSGYCFIAILFLSILYLVEEYRKRKRYNYKSLLCIKYEEIYKALTINERIQWVQKELNNEKNKNR